MGAEEVFSCCRKLKIVVPSITAGADWVRLPPTNSGDRGGGARIAGEVGLEEVEVMDSSYQVAVAESVR